MMVVEAVSVAMARHNSSSGSISSRVAAKM